MNTDQIQSLARSILKIAGAALVAHGMTSTASWLNTPDVSGAILALVGLVWSHYAHSPVSPQPPQLNLPLSVFAFLVVPAVMFMGGCSTDSQTVAFKAAGATQVGVETAMGEWGAYVAAQKSAAMASTNSAAQLAKLASQESAVKDGYGKYQTAMAALCDAGAAYSAAVQTNASPGTLAGLSAALQTAAQNLPNEMTDLESLIMSFGVNLK